MLGIMNNPNSQVLKNRASSRRVVYNDTMIFLSNWKQAHESTHNNHPRTCHTSDKWSPPVERRLKCNIDASIFSRTQL